jgi:hypothetical protein
MLEIARRCDVMAPRGAAGGTGPLGEGGRVSVIAKARAVLPADDSALDMVDGTPDRVGKYVVPRSGISNGPVG